MRHYSRILTSLAARARQKTTRSVHPRIGFAIALFMASVVSPAAARQSNGMDEDIDRKVERIRSATESFKSLDEAVAMGYARNGGRCLDNLPAGAMGFHHQNAALLDDQLELEHPEILVYERLPDGEYRLNGVEYIVPFSSVPMDAEPPTIMGQDLKPAPSLRLWYLHVWVWEENPSGLFADWNPRVKCGGGSR